MSVRNLLKLQDSLRKEEEEETKTSIRRIVSFNMIGAGILMIAMPHWGDPSPKTVMVCDTVGLGMITGGLLGLLYFILTKRGGKP